MSSLSDRDRVNLIDMVNSIMKIESFIVGINGAIQFYKNEKTFDSVLMNLVIIAESAERLSQDFKTENDKIDWRGIKSFRNFIVHNYFGIDHEEVWGLIHSNLPDLKVFIQNSLIDKHES